MVLSVRFSLSMIWGYGPVGYGAWRTMRVLESNEAAPERLAEAARVVDDDEDGTAGFRNIAGRPLRTFGVAFGTKYLYFLSLASASKRGWTDGTSVAPVLDDVVRRWVLAHTGTQLRIDRWHIASYETYLKLLDGWGVELQLRRDEVEELIFRSQITQDRSRFWSEGWMAGVGEREEGEVADALDALRQLREALGALQSESSALDEAAPSLQAIADIIDRRRR